MATNVEPTIIRQQNNTATEEPIIVKKKFDVPLQQNKVVVLPKQPVAIEVNQAPVEINRIQAALNQS